MFLDASIDSFSPGFWPLDLYSAATLAMALTGTLLVVLTGTSNTMTLCRPAYLVGAALNLSIQWPLVLFSDSVQSILSNPWPLSLGISTLVNCLVIWVRLTTTLTPAPVVMLPPKFLGPGAWVVVAIPLLVITYLWNVPFQCTGLAALVLEPSMASLAREISVKMNTSDLGNVSIGALTNVFIPVLSGLSLGQLVRSLRTRGMVVAGSFLVVIFVCLAILLIPAIKGLLIPTAIMLLVCVIFWFRRPLVRVVASAVVVLSLGGLLAGIETLREQPYQLKAYRFGECASTVGSPEIGMQMLDSVRYTGGFGLPAQDIDNLITFGQRTIPPEQNSQPQQFGGPGVTVRLAANTSRFTQYVHGLAIRAFSAPLNMAVFHYRFSEDFGSPGLGAVPFAKKLFGVSVDVPSLVFHEYVAPQSSTNRDSSGSAPTTFLVAWLAYYGPLGLVATFLIVAGLDISFTWAMRRRLNPMLPIIVGLGCITVFNVLASDLAPVLVSHGGIAAILIAIWLGHGRKPSSTSTNVNQPLS